MPEHIKPFVKSRSRQDYGTPRELIAAVERRFGHIAWDLAAHGDNFVVPAYLGPDSLTSEDSLAFDWSQLSGGPLWLNPPFGNIEPWATKCAAYMGPEKVLFLVPASCGSRWWEKHVHEKASVLFLQGRLCFNGIASFPRDCALCIYPRVGEAYALWGWKHDVRSA